MTKTDTAEALAAEFSGGENELFVVRAETHTGVFVHNHVLLCDVEAIL